MNNADPKDVQDMYVETFEEGARKAASRATLETTYSDMVSLLDLAVNVDGDRKYTLMQLKAIGVTSEMVAQLANQRPDLYKWLSQK